MVPEQLKGVNGWSLVTVRSIELRLFGNSSSQVDKGVPDQHRTESCHSPTDQKTCRSCGLACSRSDTWVLRKKGLNKYRTDHVKDLYRNVSVHMKLWREYTELINIKVRVSQGNQMSLLLFNLANKPLIFVLESDGSCD